jgi:Skp family chaperone for outer membrane proteins
MRNLKLALIFASLSVFFVCNFSVAADVAKIGVIDLQRVIETSNQGKTSQGTRSHGDE